MRLSAFLVPLLIGLPVMATAQSCQEIRFASGTTAAEIRGTTPVEGVACYTIEVGDGQTARVTVEGPNATAVSVVGVADNRDDLTWTTQAGIYELLVHQTFRSVQAEPFVMRVSVTN